MKLILWGLIFITIVKGYNIPGNGSLSGVLARHRRDDTTPEILKVKYHDREYQELIVLKKIADRTLASFLVPIWNTDDYIQLSDQYMIQEMEPIFYHGISSFSAVTYFPHTRTLHGVINSKFYIENLPIQNVEDPRIVNEFIHPIPDFKPLQDDHLRIRRSDDTIKMQGETNEKRKYDESAKHQPSKKKLKMNDDHKKILYPEIFLVVDVLSRIDVTISHPYEKAIMYVIAYWNAVDMLFRQLKRTEIKLNIAGIIIGKTVDVVNNVVEDGTYYRILDDSHVDITNEKSLERLGQYFYEIGLVKRDSFDFLIWMTSAKLVDENDADQETFELGIAAPPAESGGMHEYEIRNEIISNRAIVMHNNEYGGFQTAARELAHMMFVFNDDIEISYGCHIFNCLPTNSLINLSSGIMDPGNKQVEADLMWSFCSEIHFENYANSKLSCGLTNYPIRTMGWQDPPPALTADSQCECYRMRAHNNEFYEGDICDELLYCLTEQGESKAVGKPLDGTPCVVDETVGICNHNECA